MGGGRGYLDRAGCFCLPGIFAGCCCPHACTPAGAAKGCAVAMSVCHVELELMVCAAGGRVPFVQSVNRLAKQQRVVVL